MIFEELRPQLFSLAYRMMGTRADAEDIVQDAFEKVWRKLDQIDATKSKTYLSYEQIY